MPQTSSSGMSHRQVATAFHFLILTFIGGQPSLSWILNVNTENLEDSDSSFGRATDRFLEQFGRNEWLQLVPVQRTCPLASAVCGKRLVPPTYLGKDNFSPTAGRSPSPPHHQRPGLGSSSKWTKEIDHNPPPRRVEVATDIPIFVSPRTTPHASIGL